MSGASSISLEDQITGFDPTDPEALAALEKAAMGGEESTAGDDEKSLVDSEKPDAGAKEPQKPEPAKTDEKTGTDQATGAEAQKDGQATEEGAASGAGKTQGVQAKDGNHIIPYSVLERERDRAARAEATARALADQLEKLQSGKPAATGEETEAVQLTAEDLTQLDTDLPSVAKVIRAQMKAIEQLTGTVQTLQQENEIAQNSRKSAAQDETESAIQGNPDILAWRDAANRKDNPDPLMWNRAADLDAVLRNDPVWRDRPLAERFAKVADSIKTIYGAPAAPAATEKPAAPQPATPQKADLKQVADAALKAAPAATPSTLSDIPGGAPPAQGDIETLENASSVALGQKFMRMSQDEMDAYFSRLGI